MKRGYGQFCPIAKASEIFATRWTPLVLRELMYGAHTFNHLLHGVPLMSRPLLSERLRQLEADGIIEKRLHRDGPGHEYWLTRQEKRFVMSFATLLFGVDPTPATGSPPPTSTRVS
jgi:DNA-binding HxlR family transcriptional regulator